MSAVNCPNVVGPAVRAETTDGAQTRHESSWIVVKFRRSYIAKRTLFVKYIMKLKLSLFSTRVLESHVPVFWVYHGCSVHTSSNTTPRDSRTEIVLIAFCFEHDAVRCRL